MTINIQKKENLSIIIVDGRIDSTTANDFDRVIKQEINEFGNITVDFEKLEYISSAGLRVLLATQKVMSKKGKFIIKNVQPAVMEVFEATGFNEILTIE